MSKIETLDEDSWYFKLPGCNCSRNKIQCGNIGPELKHDIEAMCKLLAAQDFVSLHLNVCAYVLKHERFKEVCKYKEIVRYTPPVEVMNAYKYRVIGRLADDPQDVVRNIVADEKDNYDICAQCEGALTKWLHASSR
eukprot:gene19705-26396_t